MRLIDRKNIKQRTVLDLKFKAKNPQLRIGTSLLQQQIKDT